MYLKNSEDEIFEAEMGGGESSPQGSADYIKNISLSTKLKAVFIYRI
jgi:hypothetical protein